MKLNTFKNQMFGFGDPQAIRGHVSMTPSKNLNIIYFNL